MIRCCMCDDEFDHSSWGITAIPTGSVIGPKSGRPMPIREQFPDGQEEKFVCGQCLIDTELYVALGLAELGHDTPEETFNENSVQPLWSPNCGQ